MSAVCAMTTSMAILGTHQMDMVPNKNFTFTSFCKLVNTTSFATQMTRICFISMMSGITVAFASPIRCLLLCCGNWISMSSMKPSLDSNQQCHHFIIQTTVRLSSEYSTIVINCSLSPDQINHQYYSNQTTLQIQCDLVV